MTQPQKYAFQGKKMFSRPKTAQAYTYKKITEILEAKYMQLQSKTSSKQLQPNSDQKRYRQSITSCSMRPSSCRKVNKNVVRENPHGLKQNGVSLNFLEIEKMNLQVEQKLKNEKLFQKQNNFIPYQKQRHDYVSVSQPVCHSKTQKKRMNRKQQDEKEQAKMQKEGLGQDIEVESWRNEQDENSINFSSLFKKSWRF